MLKAKTSGKKCGLYWDILFLSSADLIFIVSIKSSAIAYLLLAVMYYFSAMCVRLILSLCLLLHLKSSHINLKGIYLNERHGLKVSLVRLFPGFEMLRLFSDNKETVVVFLSHSIYWYYTLLLGWTIVGPNKLHVCIFY